MATVDSGSGADGPQPSVFLHGTLDVSVIAARDVEGPRPGRFSLRRIERAVTSSADGVDPYVSVKLGYNKIMQTPVVQNTSSPTWNAQGVFRVAHDVDSVEFRVKAAKRSGLLSVVSKVKHLSMCAVSATALVERRVVEGWFPLGTYRAEQTIEGSESDDGEPRGSPKQGSPCCASSSGAEEADEENVLGSIQLRIVFTPISAEGHTLANIEVPDTYFPARYGSNVTMYQTADVPPGTVPRIPFRPDYEARRCWHDLATAIVQATEFVYIAGWSVWTELKLIRTDFPGDANIIPNNMTLGELLKWKADNGVTVCVMVWDEVASMNVAGGLYKSDGVMNTHDEKLVKYFKHTKVNAIKATRLSSKKEYLATLHNEVLFTHHQKTVIYTRRDERTGKNRVEAFVGGLDLTNGRYDNPAHSLFRTIKGVNGPPDFYQACALDVTEEAGPREPWQDIHSRVTGTAAWDVLANFEGRWMCQAPRSQYGALHPRPGERFVVPDDEDRIRDGPWNVQILRSITAASTALDSSRSGIIARQDVPIDRSIHYGYIHQIRRAKSFIYLENQYFLGSSHLWDSGQRGGFSSNLVPVELAEKICAKIRANERFAVYLTVPMYPEGPPASAAVQEILSFQRKTVALITTRVANTIKETGSNSKITDWFNVFCLVNRESYEGNQGNGGTNDTEKTLAASRRFMIYVHSKYGCFDDTAAIIGSANINSRSLDGSRDSEIAALVWQPEHVASGSTAYGNDVGVPSYLPQGDVAAFRCGVWSSHLGNYYSQFQDPASLECVNLVRDLAAANYNHFAAEGVEPSDMPHGHLALYPYSYDENGEVTTTQEYFPDFPNALVKGKAGAIPNIVTG